MTSDIGAKLDFSRKELLDLGLRNPLINYRTRSNKIEVVDEISDEVYKILVEQTKAMTFLPLPKQFEENGDDSLEALLGADDSDWASVFSEEFDEAEDGLASRHSDTKLQTKLVSEKLHAQLLKMYRGAKTYIEEQGVNTLYLALGFLHWRDAKSSEIDRRAPLILIPVELQRESARDRFKLKYNEEDIGPNLSLVEKLLAEHHIKLPSFSSVEEIAPSKYFDNLAKAVSSCPEWFVNGNEICLGFFSFGKFLMFKDLDPAEWVSDGNGFEHDVLNALLGEGFREASIDLPDDVNIDDVPHIRDMLLVKDADSSQSLAIHQINNGRNIVIQGPPGTGKSQTITNVIAESVGKGKKILFVAEKMAALDVVKRRLDQIGLGDAALELHSHKARKKDILQELGRTIELGKPKVSQATSDIEQLATLRDRLNNYATAVNEPVGETGISPIKALGKLVKLRGGSEELALLDFEQMKDWSLNDFYQKRLLVEQMQHQLQSCGLPSESPFWGSQLTVFLPTDEGLIRDSLAKALVQTQILESEASELATELSLPDPKCPKDISAICDAATRAFNAPKLDGVVVDNEDWQARRDDLKALIAAGQILTQLHEKYDSLFITSAWGQDLQDIRESYVVYGDKWWRILSSKYRAARNRFAGICKSDPPKTRTDVLDAVDAVLEAQNRQAIFEKYNKLGALLFGAQWEAEASNWSVLERIATWIIDLHDDVGKGQIPKGILNFLSGMTPKLGLGNKADSLRVRLKDHSEAVAQVLDKLEAGKATADGLSVADTGLVEAPLQTQKQTFSRWSEDIPKLRDLVNFNLLAKEMKEKGLEFVLPRTFSEDAAKSGLVTCFESTWYNGILSRAYSERDPLRQFSRAQHEFTITKFRELDEQILETNRAILALKHWEGMPRFSAQGEVAVIKRELNKKRRHVPLRKLFAEAGRAIQDIKPLFMMSPMSIATYIPPGILNFDIVIFDEASQVKPVDAFGAIMRSKQAVVVGDDKQLPPTDFFQSLAGEPSDDDDEDMTLTGDMESILSLFAGKNAPQQMLRWHYRSEHESLIAVSNHEFYDHKLVLFPSPRINQEAPGLQFCELQNTHYDRGKTRTNQGEARAVAMAVMQHADKYPHLTLGVVAFSSAQRDAIDFQLELLRRKDSSKEHFFAEGKIEPVFVKNLENVQGDERDFIFVSVGYGKSVDGYMAMNFGPLNREGGERRLNVLVTRARKCCRVFANFNSDDLDLNRSSQRGVAALKTYLKYAKTGIIDVPIPVGGDAESPFEEEVAKSLTSLGYKIEMQIGSGGFRVDLGVVDPEKPGRYLLGIECDGATYHSARSARDRDRLREQVLIRLGWRIHRIWSTDWFLDREKEVRRAVEAIEKAKLALKSRDSESKRESEARSALPEIERTSETKYEDVARDWIIPYVKAEIDVNLGDQQLHEVSLHKLSNLIVEVVKIESPIHSEEVMRRIVECTGLKKVGSRISAALDKAIEYSVKNSRIKRKEEFLFSKEQQEVLARDRSDLDPSSRKFEYISDEELVVVIKKIVAEAYSIPQNELVSESFRVLGFQRVTERAQVVFTRALRLAQKRDLIATKNGGFVAS